jgi:hypothetical protein
MAADGIRGSGQSLSRLIVQAQWTLYSTVADTLSVCW